MATAQETRRIRLGTRVLVASAVSAAVCGVNVFNHAGSYSAMNTPSLLGTFCGIGFWFVGVFVLLSFARLPAADAPAIQVRHEGEDPSSASDTWWCSGCRKIVHAVSGRCAECGRVPR